MVITLTEPNQNFLFTLTGPAGLVFKAGDTTDLKTDANGTGPFALERWSQGDSLTFLRNDAYWGEAPGSPRSSSSTSPTSPRGSTRRSTAASTC